MSVEAIIGSIEPLITAVSVRLAELGLPSLEDHAVDHVCYRVATLEQYQQTKTALLSHHGSLAVEGMINGRPIACIRLHTPLTARLPSGKEVNVPCVELPCPKAGSPYAVGLEHLEVVIGGADSTPWDSRAQLEAFMARHANVEWDTRALDKHCNADVSVQVTPEYCVKFHECALLRVVQAEKDSGIVVPVPAGYFDDAK
jgi:predicted metalloenzyme YecM